MHQCKRYNDLQLKITSRSNSALAVAADNIIQHTIDEKSYDTFSEFFYNLTHPNEMFMSKTTPLIDINPVAVWKVISTVLLAGNILLLTVFLKP